MNPKKSIILNELAPSEPKLSPVAESRSVGLSVLEKAWPSYGGYQIPKIKISYDLMPKICKKSMNSDDSGHPE